MIKKLMLISLFVFVGAQIKAQDGWVKQKIDDHVTVGFPVAPKKINDNSTGIRDQEGVIYMVTNLDLVKIMGTTVENFNAQVGTPTFADEFLKGMKTSTPNFVLSPIKITKLKEKPCYQLSGRDDKSKTTMYMNIVFVDGISYSLTAIVPDGKSLNNKDIFLTNITVVN